jgi:DNA-binding TFAR19-related protein (PDSD5 family)
MIWFGACQILHKSFIKHIQSFNLLFRLCPTWPAQQVQAAPKKRPQASTNKDKTEQMEPVTFREKVITKLSDWLGVAAKSRTASITLSSLEFADELAKKLINHALTMEKTYLRVNEAVKDKRTNEKDYEAILSNMTEKLNANEKLQAGPVELWLGVINKSSCP